MSQYERLLNGETVVVNYDILTWLLKNMNDINTLKIQKSNNVYYIRVDDITIQRYKELKAEA